MQNIFAIRLGRLAALGLFLSAAAASASGIYFPENGSEILGRGGADVGFLDSAYALQFNPAGMAMRDGLDIRADIMLINPGESFTQANANLNPDKVKASNGAGLSPGPMVMVSYRPPSLRWIAFGLGIWAPPGILNYQFPNPANFSGKEATTQTPQRYNLISQSNIVLYPSVGLAFRPIKYISFGGTLEYIYSTTQLSEAASTLPASDASLFGINPYSTDNDVTAKLNVNGRPRVTGLFGLIIQPIEGLTVAGSFQLYQPIVSTGTIDLTGSELLTRSPTGPQLTISPSNPASLAINLPPVARAGISYTWKRLHISAEYVWEGWQVNNQFTVSTSATVTSTLLPACKPGMVSSTCVPPTVSIPAVQNHWHNTNGFRGGLGYDILAGKEDNGFSLQVNAGVAYDPNAVPSETQTLPFATGNIIGPSAGLTFDWKGFGVSGSFMYDIPQTFTVSNSTQTQVSPIPGTMGQTIGNGVYQTNFWVLGLGLHYHWDQT